MRRRSARRASTITTTARRATSPQRVFRGHIALARELDLPLVIHARDADDDMAAILTRRNGAGAVPRRAPLLHRLARTRRDRARPRALDLVFRRRDVQEVGGLARHRARRSARPHSGRDRRALSRADAPSRPPQRAGLRRRHGGRGRRGARDDAGSAGRGDARQHAHASFSASCELGRRQAAAGVDRRIDACG